MLEEFVDLSEQDVVVQNGANSAVGQVIQGYHCMLSTNTTANAPLVDNVWCVIGSLSFSLQKQRGCIRSMWFETGQTWTSWKNTSSN